jgi:hypothetical protein
VTTVEFGGITPENVSHQAIFRDISEPINLLDVLDLHSVLGEEPSVDYHNLGVEDVT